MTAARPSQLSVPLLTLLEGKLTMVTGSVGAARLLLVFLEVDSSWSPRFFLERKPTWVFLMFLRVSFSGGLKENPFELFEGICF